MDHENQELSPTVSQSGEPQEVVLRYEAPVTPIVERYVQPTPLPGQPKKHTSPRKKRKGLKIFLFCMLGLLLVSGVVTALWLGGAFDDHRSYHDDDFEQRHDEDYYDNSEHGETTIKRLPNTDQVKLRYNESHGEALTIQEIYQKVNPSTVTVVTELPHGASVGTGVILTEDGYIITNAHVLTNGKSFRVIMSDETEYPATVIGKDNKTDLAVIKIEGSDFPAAVMGNSDEVVLGESVVAIGNPAGLSGSVTNGIVSGLNRQIRSDATGFDMNCIQTNAAISPGNSGGALVNMYGQVIGITSSKYVSSSYEGLGFAITINEVLPIVQDLIDNGYVADRVRVGITFISLIPEEVRQGFADEIGMKTVPDNLSGVWITEIADDCDIASTDLQVNDVIVSVQGEAVDDYDSLNAAIAGLKGGDTIEARCRRYQPDGNFEEFSIQCKLMADTSGNY